MKIIINKILFVFTLLLIALLAFEIILRILGFSVSAYQNYANNKKLNKASQCRIMCLGESMTAGQYPLQLQKILDKKYPGKFAVIDCGIRGTVLEVIYMLLDMNIEKYNPDIVICMMGNNNGFFMNQDYINKINLDNSRSRIKLYKLYLLLIKGHIDNLKDLYFNKKTLNADSKNERAYYKITDTYRKYKIFNKIVYERALKALDMNFRFHKIDYYRIVIVNNLIKDNYKKAVFFINKLLDDNEVIEPLSDYYSLIEINSMVRQFLTEEQKTKMLDKISSIKTDRSLGSVAVDYIRQKKFSKAEEFFDMTDELRMNFPNQETNRMYRLIVKQLINNNIKVICMQYPVRDVKILQNIFKDEDYYDKITFVSNEDNFKKVLKTRGYDSVFKDQVSGDIGHCNNYGNTLIADNAAAALENLMRSRCFK